MSRSTPASCFTSSQQSLTLNSYAKVNLYLNVLNKRSDKYHNLKTIFERISLADKITLKLRRDNKILIYCSDANLNKSPRQNLAFKSAKLLKDSLGIEKGVEIRIKKSIPLGSGMGGGSSNAATVLLGLNKLWRLKLSRTKLLDYCLKLGSDVPFFVYNVSFAQGEGRGDRIKPLINLKDRILWHILVVPRIKVSTPLIYAKYDEFKCRRMNMLTSPEYDVKILSSGISKNGLSLIKKGIYNSLEEVTARLYPEVQEVKNRLSLLGLRAILMSGSGPAVFGICSSRKEAVGLEKRLKRLNNGWRVFVVRTI